jgi:glycosyltransferase involved in cell wall biosynthesis
MRFASGISAYTVRLANALAERHEVSVLLLRELLPRRLFPGRERIGAYASSLAFSDGIEVCDGLDWYVLPSALRVARFIRAADPEVIVLPWWTGAAAHSELLIAVANLAGPRAKIVLELHETLDGIEDSQPLLRTYSMAMRSVLVRMAGAFVVHSEADRRKLLDSGTFDAARVFVVPHGSYDHFVMGGDGPQAKHDTFTYVSFGLIRPYKGIDLLVEAFSALPEELARESRLVIAGEVWEDTMAPRKRAEASPYRDRIEFIERYLSDHEVSTLFAASDVAVFPYRRASHSGVLSIAMAHGIPVIASDLGGLGEAAREYDGGLLVPPEDVTALTDALIAARKLAGRTYADPFPWSRTAEAYDGVFA